MFVRADFYVENDNEKRERLDSKFISYSGEPVGFSETLDYQEYQQMRHDDDLEDCTTIYALAEGIFDYSSVDPARFSHLSRGTDSRNRDQFNNYGGGLLSEEEDVTEFLDIGKLREAVTVKLSDPYISDI